jgi:predicted lipoprotein with Yx(FWY)xxD motif
MRSARWYVLPLVACGLAGLVAAGCSGPRSGPGGGPPRPSTGAVGASPDDDEHQIPPARPVVVELHGAVLTDAAGLTLYTFSADGPLAPRCTGVCAQRWRPATSAGGKPQAGAGVSAADIGSVRRDDGSYQVTYHAAPLYYFTGDARAGDRDGSDREEFGGRWSCAPPGGTAIH